MATTILTNCRIIDGSSSEPIEDVCLAIDDDTITAIDRQEALQPLIETADRAIDLQGWTLLPGLMNMHVHLALSWPRFSRKVDIERAGESALRCLKKAQDALYSGVTTLRSVGDPKVSAIDVRNAINSGLFTGPRVFASGGTLITTGGHGHNGVNCLEADGPYEFRRLAREQIKLGADLIKVCLTGGIGTPGEGVDTGQVTEDEMRAATEIAHKFDKHITVHAGGSVPIAMALEVGVDCVEHGYVFDERVARMMAERGTYLVPTLVVTHGLDYMKERGCPDYMLDKTRSSQVHHVKSIRSAYELGVKICNGTDMLPDDETGGTTATVHELELMVQAVGMTPLDAIRASTRNPAELLGIADRVGTVAPGMAADLVGVPGKPDRDISAMRDIGFVMKDGRIIREELPG